MEEKYQLKEGCLTIQMPKELDHHEAGRLKMEADFLIGAYHVRRLVFDFRETEFMDSSGIGLLMGRYRALDHWKMQEHVVFRRRSGSNQYE